MIFLNLGLIKIVILDFFHITHLESLHQPTPNVNHVGGSFMLS